MARLFWLSDKAWAALEPHLPHGRPGKPSVDDRRVISGIPTCSRPAAAGGTFCPSTVRPPRSTIATTGGPVPPQTVAALVRAGGRPRLRAPRTSDRHLAREGAPLGIRRKRGNGTKLSGVPVVGAPQRSIAWPMIVADRLRLR